MEYFNFHKKTYNLTQGYGKDSYSHKNTIAIDVSGKGGSLKVYAPFTGYVGKVYSKKSQTYTCWLVSENKVICGDGSVRYAVCMISHPWEIANLSVGDKFSQGDYLMNDGRKNATSPNLNALAFYKVLSNLDAL